MHLLDDSILLMIASILFLLYIQVMTSIALQQRLKDKNITVSSIHPGFVRWQLLLVT